jgi:hypothetical protein
MSNFTQTDAGRDYTFGVQALKRLAEPEDIGGVVAFPCPPTTPAGSAGTRSMSMAARNYNP